MLLNPKMVNNTKYLATTVFPNENVPFLNAELHKYVAQGYAKYIEDDKPFEVPVAIAEDVGKVTLSPLPVEPEKVKVQPLENLQKEPKPESKKEEKVYKSNYQKVSKKGK